MFQNLSTFKIISLTCIFIFFKYMLFGGNPYDFQYILSILLFVTNAVINFYGNYLSNDIRDTGKFMEHTLFISVCFSLVCNLISCIYGIFFYYGFINTIIMLNMIIFVTISGFVNIFGQQIVNFLGKSTLGSKVLMLLNYYYNTYILSMNIGQKIYHNGAKAVKKSWIFTKIFVKKYFHVYQDLSNNTKSKLVISNLSTKIENTKSYFINCMLQPYFIRSFSDTLMNDPFRCNIEKLGDSQKNKDDISYKNTLCNESINMNFLDKSKIEEDFDDLDEQPDMSNVMEVSKEQIDEAEKINADVQNVSSSEVRRIKYRQKIAEKKMQRTGKSRNQTINPDLMNMPGMNEMMQTMLQGNNLEKLMKQMPRNNDTLQMPTLTPDQMKNFIKTLTKNQ